MDWQLAHETHAIERVTVTFLFKETVPSKTWATILERAVADAGPVGFNSLPSASETGHRNSGVTELIINIGGPGLVQAGGGAAAPSARTFIRLSDVGEEQDRLTLQRNLLAYSTSLYGGWGDFIDTTEKLIAKSLDLALTTVDVGMVKLEYWDRFVFIGDENSIDYNEVISNESKFVPSFFVAEKGLWHSHIGYFADPGTSARRLINLNVDVIDVAGPPDPEAPEGTVIPRRSVGIYSMAQDTLEVGGAEGSVSVRGSTLDEMHTILKEVLANAITPVIADRISLNPRG